MSGLPGGCSKLYVADSNWKLRYVHCMWEVPVLVPGLGKVKYPNICSLSPKWGHAFCLPHCEIQQNSENFSKDVMSMKKKLMRVSSFGA